MVDRIHSSKITYTATMKFGNPLLVLNFKMISRYAKVYPHIYETWPIYFDALFTLQMVKFSMAKFSAAVVVSLGGLAPSFDFTKLHMKKKQTFSSMISR